MAITFAVRGNSMTAYYAQGTASPFQNGTVSLVSSTASGVIGGSYIDLDQGVSANHGLFYNGEGNIPLTQQMSILVRAAHVATATQAQMFYIGGPAGTWANQARFSGNGIIPFSYTDAITGNSLATQNYTVALTQGRFYDFVWLLDASLTTGALTLYVDGAAVATTAGSGTRAALASARAFFIALGTQNANAQSTTRMFLNEFVIWDNIINPASVTISTGVTASLNGTARTSFVNSLALAGASVTSARTGVTLGTPRMF